MLKVGNNIVSGLQIGTIAIKSVYAGAVKIYPDGIQTNSGTVYGTWIYSAAIRTRSVTNWTQEVYQDGTSGPVINTPAPDQSETASTSYRYGSWGYYSDNSYRQRSQTLVYTFSDTVRDGATDPVSESGSVSYGNWSYNAAIRTRTVTYTYSDTSMAGTAQSQTASTSYRYGSWGYYSDNSYRQRLRTLVYTFSDTVRDGATDPVSESGSVSYGNWSYNAAIRTRTVTYTYSDTSMAGTAQSQTASTSVDWSGEYRDGACSSNYYYVDYKKVRTKYTYADTITYSDYYNGDNRSRRIDGSCGWVRDWRVTSDWANNGNRCNAVGTTNGYDCSGTYRVDYHQQQRSLSFCYPDMSGSTQTSTEYRAGAEASRDQVDGVCGFIAIINNTISIKMKAVPGNDHCYAIITAKYAVTTALRITVLLKGVREWVDMPIGEKSVQIAISGTDGTEGVEFSELTIYPESDNTYRYYAVITEGWI
ncbi:MAG: hypothetical protein RR555_05570 [Bacteroidales bacterium]